MSACGVNGQRMFFNVRNVRRQSCQQQVENCFTLEDGGKVIGNRCCPKRDGEPEPLKLALSPATPGGAFGSFAAACRADKPEMANGNRQDAFYSCTAGHLMIIPYHLGEKAPFNAQDGRFGDNQAACQEFMVFGAGQGLSLLFARQSRFRLLISGGPERAPRCDWRQRHAEMDVSVSARGSLHAGVD